MHAINVYEVNGSLQYSEKPISSLELASIQVIQPIANTVITAREGMYVADNNEWIMIQPIDSLLHPQTTTNEHSAVDKQMVISRIQNYLRQQPHETNEVTLSNTSTHCEVIGGRIAKQVVSTIEARKYLNDHLNELGWEVAKAGKDFITMKRKTTTEEYTEEAGKAEVQQAFNNHESETNADEDRTGFFGFLTKAK